MGISSYRCQPIVDGVGKPELKRATILYAIPAGEKCRTTSSCVEVHVIRAENLH